MHNRFDGLQFLGRIGSNVDFRRGQITVPQPQGDFPDVLGCLQHDHCAGMQVMESSPLPVRIDAAQNASPLPGLNGSRTVVELLNTQYFHVVSTLPQQIAAVAYQNKRELYGILFKATAETLLAIAADPKHLGAEIGFFAVLHTWGSNLLHRPHLHCVVPGGGLSPTAPSGFPVRLDSLSVRVLSRLFRRLFLEYLFKAFDAGKLEFFSSLELLRDRSSFLDYLAPLREAEWVVYAKRPFAPEQVLDYVGRYTHRVAISNNRLLDIAEDKVTFRYKDYRHDAQQKTMTLEADEFIRRFLLHVLPDRFQRIRYYGFLANRYRDRN